MNDSWPAKPAGSELCSVAPGAPPDMARRKLVGAAAATAGVAHAISGFPLIWAQDIKNIELRHAGSSTGVVKAVTERASRELGFKVSAQVLGPAEHTRQMLEHPESADVMTLQAWQTKLATKQGMLQGIQRSRIKEFDNILPIFTRGVIDRKPTSRQGISPYETLYIAKPRSTALHDGPTEWLTFLPQIYNADSIGYRPDLVKRTVTQWKDLIDPAFRGKAAIVADPAVGMMDAALSLESAGEIKYRNKGNMTRKEIDLTVTRLIDLKKQGHFRATWSTFDQSVQQMASGEVVIQSMWTPAVAALRVKGVPCTYAPVRQREGKEGYRGWCQGLALMRHLSGKKLDAAYEYLNWYLSGWQGAFVARYGYYSPVPSTAKKYLKPSEWVYWYDGRPATDTVLDPFGVAMEKSGTLRDGGSFLDRVSNISCWNTLMDEAPYMNKRWREFMAA
jgi:putative spermidine/putrescine transport system substrate-binding protein